MPKFLLQSNPVTTEGITYNGAQVFIADRNRMLNQHQLSDEQKIIMSDYRLIQYDLVAGKQ